MRIYFIPYRLFKPPYIIEYEALKDTSKLWVVKDRTGRVNYLNKTQHGTVVYDKNTAKILITRMLEKKIEILQNEIDKIKEEIKTINTEGIDKFMDYGVPLIREYAINRSKIKWKKGNV